MAIESSNDPRGFAAFEHDGWESVGRGYEQHLSVLTRQSANALLDAAEVSAVKRVLDVCCGPGIVTSAAVARGARVVGIDFSAAVIDIAIARVPGAEFRVGDAQSLPFADRSFDAVSCGFGIIHVPDPRQALTEMRRVLKPGGRVAVSVWEAPSQGNGFGLLYGAIGAHADMNVDLPHGPDFFQFSEPARLTGALLDTGFVNPSVVGVEQTWELGESSGLFTAFMEGAVRARALVAAQDEAVRAAIADAIATGMGAFAAADGTYRLPMPALVGAASKQ